MTIGIVVQDISSPFFDETLRGVDDGLKGTGFASVIVSGHWNADEEADRIRLLLARKVDGIILLSGRMSDETVLNFSTQRPIVSTGRALKTRTALGFKLDNEYGAYLAVHHLIELGHRASPSSPVRPTTAMPTSAWPATSARCRKPASPLDEQADRRRQLPRGQRHAGHEPLFDTHQQFTAVFAANDLSAYGARLACTARASACRTISRWSASMTCPARPTPPRR
jgi:LacI family transcriptional regulator